MALLNWLSESPYQAEKIGTPGYLSVGMACEFHTGPFTKRKMLT